MIDTHAHLDFKEFDPDRDEVIRRAYAGGVEKIINVGCNLERSRDSIELARKYKNIYASIGVHPHDVGKYKKERMKDELEKLIQSNKVVAIGECGLDYYRLEKEEDKEKQKEFFKIQLEIAYNKGVPLIIHCRDAFNDLLEILKDSKFKNPNSKQGVTHCFSGNRQIARQFLELGFLISFTGSITYTKPEGELLKVVKEVPLEKIMIETDCPYLAPVPHRGERNEPLYVKYIAEKIAEVKGIDLEEVKRKTTENAKWLFGLE